MIVSGMATGRFKALGSLATGREIYLQRSCGILNYQGGSSSDKNISYDDGVDENIRDIFNVIDGEDGYAGGFVC